MFSGPPNASSLREKLRDQFGDIDLYAFDALLQGYWTPPQRFLDAGCGTGRNLPCFLDAGFSVRGLDCDEDALEVASTMAQARRPDLPDNAFRAEPLESNTFDERSFDAILCNAVLHFAVDTAHFSAMLHGLWRLLAEGGTALIRLGTRIGMEGRVIPVGDGRYQQPDGAIWFLPDAQDLTAFEREVGAQRPRPLKTTWVDGRRAMSTWWLRRPLPKPSAP
jgi:tellurite methyltransferase